MAPLTALLGGKITLSLCICPHRLQFSTTCNDTDLVLFHTELPFDQEGPGSWTSPPFTAHICPASRKSGHRHTICWKEHQLSLLKALATSNKDDMSIS